MPGLKLCFTLALFVPGCCAEEDDEEDEEDEEDEDEEDEGEEGEDEDEEEEEERPRLDPTEGDEDIGSNTTFWVGNQPRFPVASLIPKVHPETIVKICTNCPRKR